VAKYSLNLNLARNAALVENYGLPWLKLNFPFAIHLSTSKEFKLKT
jgi:hypothetical protein